jgi:hypothetical protein
MLVPSILIIFLSGCRLAERMDLQGELNGTADGGASDGGAQLQPVLEQVDPAYGLTSGGDEITLYGENLDERVEVFFGEQPAALGRVSAGSLTVTLPASVSAGTVDVTVRNEAGEAVLDDGFRYWSDGTGKTGAIGYLERTDYVGDSWADGNSTVVVGAVAFVEPTTFEWFDLYAAGTEQCASNRSVSGSLSFLDPGLSSLELVSGSRAVELPWNSSSGYFAASLNESDFVASASYDLEEVQVGSLGVFGISGLVQTPSTGLRITSPDVENDLPFIGKSLPITWTGGYGELAIIELGLLDTFASSIVEVVTCVVDDDGSFTVPSSAWQGWESLRYMTVSVSVTRASEAVLPINNANVGVLGIYTKIGIGYTLY